MIDVPGYRIAHLLSWGSQGDVFLAQDAEGNDVALKIVTADRADSAAGGRERLRREARLLRSIASPHVVAVRGIVENEDLCCLVLEFLRGQRLDQVVAARTGRDANQVGTADETIRLAPGRAALALAAPVPEVSPNLCTAEHVRVALDLAMGLARGVAALHDAGLVHRDIKPENAMLVDGRVVLIDFGLARGGNVTTLTQSGALIGSLAYMSPEQLHGAPSTQRSDVYCLGATLFFLLTGHPPHGGESASLAARTRQHRPPRIGAKNAAVGRDQDAVLRRALEPDPRDRYANAGEMLLDLERCARGEVVQVPFSLGRTWRHRRRAFAGALTVVLLGLGAWLSFTGEQLSGTVGAILGAVRTNAAAAREAWQRIPDAQRDAALHELNRRLGADVELAHATARALQLGLLHTGARAGCRGVLWNEDDDAELPPLSRFLATERPRCFLARPGLAWFLFVDDNRATWWGAEDPRCLHLLVRVAVPDGLQAARPLTALHSFVPHRAWHPIAAGVHRILGTPKGETAVLLPHAQVVDLAEMSRDDLTVLERSLESAAKSRDVLDAWIAHPDEPPAAAAAFWARVAERRPRGGSMPATMTFWDAHRCAALCGARLPTTSQWFVAAREGLEVDFKRVEPLATELVAVDSVPAWDVTAGKVRYANTNVREWCLPFHGEATAGAAGGAVRCVSACPGSATWKGVASYSFFPPLASPNATPDELHGLRLHRLQVRP